MQTGLVARHPLSKNFNLVNLLGNTFIMQPQTTELLLPFETFDFDLSESKVNKHVFLWNSCVLATCVFAESIDDYVFKTMVKKITCAQLLAK
jgi:hypothetical protein